MSVIQKRADELKPGDVVVNFRGSASLVCPAICIRGLEMGITKFFAGTGDHAAIFLGYATVVDVDALDLTPAQQHAEEMLDLLCDVYARAVDPQNLIPQRIKALVDKIKPPEPPTLEEALASLGALTPHANGDPEVDVAIALLDRARRAGMLTT
jgi:hypothetical protein